MQPTTSYFICTEPRTGGHFLGEWLRSTGIAGNPEEYFWRDNEPGFREDWGTTTYSEFLLRALDVGSTENGVFGAKVGRGGGSWEHFRCRLGELKDSRDQAAADPDVLDSVFPNLHYIFLTRRNKVRQAVSWWRAIQTGVWSFEQKRSAAQKQEPEYKYDAIDHLLQEIVFREASWEEYFTQASVTPLSLTYEDMVAEPERVVAGVLRFLDLPAPAEITLAEGCHKKMADGLSEEWVQRFREQKQEHWNDKAW